MGAVRFQPPHQQLGIGSKSSERIAQLMHKRAQLLVLSRQFILELLTLQISSKRMTDGCGAATRFCVDLVRPAAGGLEVHTKCPQDQAGILEWKPAAMGIRDSQVGVGIRRWKAEASCGPLPNQDEWWTAGFRWGADIEPHMPNGSSSDLGGQLLIDKVKKSIGQLNPVVVTGITHG